MTISGLQVGRTDWGHLVIGMTGGFFLGLLSPVVVIVASHVLAEHVARLRHGMLKAPAYVMSSASGRSRHLVRAARWITRHLPGLGATLILTAASISFGLAASARLGASQVSDGTLRNAMAPVLVLLFVTLPWVVFLAHLYAENPKLEQLEALRAEDEARPPTALVLAEEAAEIAHDNCQRAKEEAIAAAARRDTAWDAVYRTVHDVLSEVDYYLAQASNISLGVRALVTWPDIRTGEPRRPLTAELVKALAEVSVDLSPLEPHLAQLERLAPGESQAQEIRALRSQARRMHGIVVLAPVIGPKTNGSVPKEVAEDIIQSEEKPQA